MSIFFYDTGLFNCPSSRILDVTFYIQTLRSVKKQLIYPILISTHTTAGYINKHLENMYIQNYDTLRLLVIIHIMFTLVMKEQRLEVISDILQCNLYPRKIEGTKGCARGEDMLCVSENSVQYKINVKPITFLIVKYSRHSLFKAHLS